MNVPSGFTIKSEIPKLLSETDLRKVHEIEQDMWAEGIGEYVKCPSCSKIHSKNDVFGHVSKDVYKETVGRLEQILALDSIKCQNCDSDTVPIWGEDYIEGIRERFADLESFITTFRDENGEIRGFTDGYINDFEVMYKRELEHYYYLVGPDKIKGMIEKLISGKLPDKLLIHNTTGLESNFSSLKTFLLLLKQFYVNLKPQGYDDIIGIYESTIGTTIHSIYHSVGGKRLGLTSGDDYGEIVSNTYGEFKSDIFIHEGIVPSFNETLNVSLKTFMKNNSAKIREVLVK